jgi:hypothetical protein
MTPATPTPADRRLYGTLVDDVYELRAAGLDVARYKGDFRVGNDVLTAAQLRGKAAEARNRRQARRPDAPRARMARHEIVKTASRAAGGDEGRDAVRQGSAATVDDLEPNAGAAGGADTPAPITEATADVPDKFWRAVGPQEPTPSTTLQGPMPNAGDGGESAATRCRPSPPNSNDLCGCGHPRSHFGRCWFRRGYAEPNVNPTRRPPRTHTARLTELEARNAALEKALAEIRAHLGMGREHR